MRGVLPTILLLALAGCSSAPRDPIDVDEPLRQTEGNPSVEADWALEGCDHGYFEATVPAASLDGQVPPPWTSYEFPPGIAYASIVTTVCDAALLDNTTRLTDIRHAALAIKVGGSSETQLYVVDWIVDGEEMAQAFRARGFAVQAGPVQVTSPAGFESRQTVVGDAGAVATVHWVDSNGNNGQGQSAQFHQLVGGQARTFVVGMPYGYTTGFQDACAMSASEPSWQAVLGPAPSRCFPFRMKDVALDYTFLDGQEASR